MSQQIYSAEDLLAGHVVVDEFSVEQMNIVQTYLEKQYSPRIDAIIKDFDDEGTEEKGKPDSRMVQEYGDRWTSNPELTRTYLARRTPLSFTFTAGHGDQLQFRLQFENSNHSYYSKSEVTTFDQVVIYFRDNVTTRSAYGTKAFDHIQRKRKIKHIAKLEPTIIEILDRLVEIAEKQRAPFLESKLANKKFYAQRDLDALEDELKSVHEFELKYQGFAIAQNVNNPERKTVPVAEFFLAIQENLLTKIKAEKAKLQEKGLL